MLLSSVVSKCCSHAGGKLNINHIIPSSVPEGQRTPDPMRLSPLLVAKKNKEGYVDSPEYVPLSPAEHSHGAVLPETPGNARLPVALQPNDTVNLGAHIAKGATSPGVVGGLGMTPRYLPMNESPKTKGKGRLLGVSNRWT